MKTLMNETLLDICDEHDKPSMAQLPWSNYVHIAAKCLFIHLDAARKNIFEKKGFDPKQPEMTFSKYGTIYGLTNACSELGPVDEGCRICWTERILNEHYTLQAILVGTLLMCTTDLATRDGVIEKLKDVMLKKYAEHGAFTKSQLRKWVRMDVTKVPMSLPS